MDELYEIMLFSLVAIGLGILALNLPYHLNPFRFKRFAANLLSENANRIVPKVFGWALIALGCLPLLGMLLLFRLNRWAASEDAARNAAAGKLVEEMRLKEVALATAVSKAVADADHFDFLVRNPQSGGFQDVLMNQEGPALGRLKEVFSGQPVAPRPDLSHALFIFPGSAISFKRNGALAVQMQLSGNLDAFGAVVPQIEEIYQNLLPPENVKMLVDALPQLKKP